MGLIRKDNGKNWYYQFNYVDEDGKRKSKSVNTGISKEKESKNMLAKATAEGLRLKEEFLDQFHKMGNKQINHQHAKVHDNDTLEEYSKYWLQELEGCVEDNTLVSYRGPLEKHILPRLGHIKLKDLDQLDVKNFIIAELEECKTREKDIEHRIKKAKGKPVKIKSSEKPYYQSIKNHLAILKMMLDYAVSEMHISTNVAKLVNKQVLKKIPTNEFSAKPYNKDEVLALRKAIEGTVIEPAVILASYLGLRREEVLGLRWQDVDFEKSKIYIRNVCVLVGSKTVYREKTKTKSSKAKLHMIDPLKQYLTELKRKQEEEKKFFGRVYQDTDLICRRSDSHPIKPNYVSQTYSKLLKKSGLRHTRFHDLRHTVGDIILEETGDIKLVSDTLRHSNIQTTADIYTVSTEAAIAKGLETLS